MSSAILVLEDGRAFAGEAYGAAGETFGEAVFATSMIVWTRGMRMSSQAWTLSWTVSSPSLSVWPKVVSLKWKVLLVGLYDAPAYVRRGLGVQAAIARLCRQCEEQREVWLEGVRLRLRAWTAMAR